ncbi:MMPL family transporter [Parafrankia sp. BMG5.11]|uniref:MMPL family transporter n=1 Tax=Parafrankia sp. BMG5.11 TaxID=222540 RepID=UPI0010391AD8|nr:MMPL family transporter [Parafrankia sp. BMG5.11]TCJ37691.1 MMPL family transporter [Parafrankia sp. BMG5.11]
MGTYLYRLGQASHRHRRVVLALWLALLGLAGAGTATLPGAGTATTPSTGTAATSGAGTATTSSAGTATPAGTAAGTLVAAGSESQRAADLLRRRLPGTGADTATARLVLTLDAGDGARARLDDPVHRQAIEDVLATLGQAPLVGRVGDPFGGSGPGADGEPGAPGVGSVEGGISSDGRMAYTQVTYTVRDTQLTARARAALFAAAGPARAAGIDVEFGGTALDGVPERSYLGSAEPAVAAGILAAAVLAAVLGVLIVAFGSSVAAALALLTAVVGVTVGGCAAWVVTSRTGTGPATPLPVPVPVPVAVLGLTVAIGGALLVVTRYRNGLAEGRRREEVAGNTVATAGSVVVLSGLMTAGTLTALSVARVPALTTIGLASAGIIMIATLGTLTLLPAVLGFAGSKVTARATGRAGRGRDGGERWGRFVVRRRIPALLLSLAALGAVAAPVADLRLGLPDSGATASEGTQRRAYDQLAAGFGAGFNGPLLLVVDAADSADPTAAAGRVRTAVAALGAVALTTEPRFDPSGDLATMTVIPVSGPGDPGTADLVRRIRAEAGALAVTTGTRVWVTGRTAIGLDVSWRLARVLPLYLTLLAALAIAVLAMASRSVLVPLKGVLSAGLSAVAALGAMVAGFQWGWLGGCLGVERSGPVAAVLPIVVIGLLTALATSHELHLVARSRAELLRTGDPGQAVVRGTADAARAVTASTIITVVASGAVVAASTGVMAGVLGALAAPAGPITASIGLVLAFGVTVDAFVVRLTLGAAVMSLLGRAAWWLPRLPDHLPAAASPGPAASPPLPAEVPTPASTPVPASMPASAAVATPAVAPALASVPGPAEVPTPVSAEAGTGAGAGASV